QSDQLRLLRPAEQRAALDRFAGPEHEKLLARFHELFTRWRAVEDDLADRRANARQRVQEADLLRLGLDEITRVDPQPGEDDLLREEAQRLEHVEGLRTAAQLAHVAIAGGEEVGDDAADAVGLISTACSASWPCASRRSPRSSATWPTTWAAISRRWTPTRRGSPRSTSGGPHC